MKRQVTTFRLNPIKDRLLEKCAQKKGKNKSDLLRKAVSDLLIEEGLI